MLRLLLGVAAADSDFDDLQMLQAVRKRARMDTPDASAELLKIQKGDGDVCPSGMVKVSDFDMCKKAASQAHLDATWKGTGGGKARDDEACYVKGKNRVYWNPVKTNGDIVCQSQPVQSRACQGSVCVIETVDPETIDEHMFVAAGANVPAPFRGLFFMDGNAMPDSVLSFNADYEQIVGTNMFQGRMLHASNIVALHDNDAGRSLFNLLENSQPNYYHVVCSFGVDMDDVKNCTISPSLFGLPPIPVQEPQFAWKMAPLDVTDSNHIKETDNPQELTFVRNSFMFGSEHQYFARRIVDQHGQRLPANWAYFTEKMRMEGRSTLGVIRNTGMVKADDPLAARIGLTAKALLGIAFPLLQDKMHFDESPVPPSSESNESALDAIMKRMMSAAASLQFNIDVPTNSRYETLVGLPGRCTPRNIGASLERSMELGIATGTAANRDNVEIAGLASVFERLIRFFNLDVWEQAYIAGGKKPINPAQDNFLLRDSPLPYPLNALLFTWHELIEIQNGLVALPLFQMPFHANGNRTYYFNQLAEQNCFEPQIFGSGTAVFKYDKVAADMADLHQKRGYYTSAILQHRQTFNVDGALFLHTDSQQHKDLRQIIAQLRFAQPWNLDIPELQNFWQGMHGMIPTITSVAEQQLSPLIDASGNLNTTVLASAVMIATQTALWGIQPDENQARGMVGYILPGTLGIFGDIIHNLITGVRRTSGEPSLTEQLIQHRKATLQFAKQSPVGLMTVQHPLVLDYIEKYPGLLAAETWNEQLGYDTEEDHFLMNMADVGMFAGYIGVNDMTTKCIQFQQQDPEMKKMFEDKPYEFIAELMRFDSAVTSFTALYQDDTQEFFEGKEITFKAGTPYQAVLAAANRDPTVFENPSTFDPTRDNLGDQLAWNGKLRHVEARDLQKAPRGCPGYCLSSRLGAGICAQAMGSWDKLMQDGKLFSPNDCNLFQQDCVGEWSEWGACSAECSQGFKTRTYSVKSAATGNGRQCLIADGTTETAPCNLQPCKTTECGNITSDGACLTYDIGTFSETCDPSLGMTLDTISRISYEALVRQSIMPVPLELVEIPRTLGLPVAAPPIDGVLLDEEVLDQFIFDVFTSVARSGHRVVKASQIPLPSRKESLRPCMKVARWCLPFADFDHPDFGEEFVEGKRLSMCGLDNRMKLAFSDDLNVENRNQWSLVLGKTKYQDMSKYKYIDTHYRKYFETRRKGSGNVDWQQLFFVGDRYHDMLDHFLAFKQIGSHRVKLYEHTDIDGAKYVLDTSELQILPVREGFSRVGSMMIFDSDGFPLCVKVQGQGTVRPGDANWDYAKFHWRASLNLAITLQDHLLGTHLSAAHALATASREHLSANHPLRALMSRYTWGSIQINFEAIHNLVSSRGSLHRVTPFADFGKAIEAGIDGLMPLNNIVGKFQTDDELLKRTPFVEDGFDNYELNQNLVMAFFDGYGWCDGSAFQDGEVQNFASGVKNIISTNYLDVQADNCVAFAKDLSVLAFAVSGFHNHVGNILGSLEDPGIASWSWVEGESFGRPKQFIGMSAINHYTNHFHYPTMDQDFSHLCNEDPICVGIFENSRNEAQAKSDVIQSRNSERTIKVGEVDEHIPYVAFDPAFSENMVAK